MVRHAEVVVYPVQVYDLRFQTPPDASTAMFIASSVRPRGNSCRWYDDLFQLKRPGVILSRYVREARDVKDLHHAIVYA